MFYVTQFSLQINSMQEWNLCFCLYFPSTYQIIFFFIYRDELTSNINQIG